MYIATYSITYINKNMTHIQRKKDRYYTHIHGSWFVGWIAGVILTHLTVVESCVVKIAGARPHPLIFTSVGIYIGGKMNMITIRTDRI